MSRLLTAASKPIVFISFATPDYAMADMLCEVLERLAGSGIDFFLAPRRLRLGTHWPAEIERNLNSAACIIVVLSEDALSSSWVPFEAGVAYGRGVDVVPLALAGFKIDRQRPPLSFLQTLTVKSADQLNEMLRRLEMAVGHKITGIINEQDHIAIIKKAPQRTPKLDTLPLLTRPDIFREATRLVEECHINSIIRGATSLVHPKDTNDKHVRPYVEALARKCGAAHKIGGHMRYDVVIGVHRDSGDNIPPGAHQAIAARARLFRDSGALPCLHMRESRDAWSMNLLLVNNEHAILGYPEGGRSSRLQYGVRISGSQIVEPMVKWYEQSLKKGTKALKSRDFL